MSAPDFARIRQALAAGVHAADLVAGAYSRIEAGSADHPAVFTHLHPRTQALDEAHALAQRAHKGAALPLLGTTFAVKDNIDVAGMPTTAACPGYAYTPVVSALTVATLLNAGAVCVGKVNLDQFATGLVGMRSPYGACRNAFDPAYISGGSSSGSAIAVAAGWVSFSLGTDTAGSGRVPAALGNIVGYKPTPGRWSTAGVVPACKSLDCVSLFTLTCDDAKELASLLDGSEQAKPLPPLRTPFRVGIPPRRGMAFFGDAEAEALYDQALATLGALGGELVEIDWGPFEAAGDLLYGGPFVAERWAAVGDFVTEHPDACLPVIRDILSEAGRYSAADAFRAQYRIAALMQQAAQQWRSMDLMALPTAPILPSRAAVDADPRGVNDALGTYTRFANLLRCAALSVPTGFRQSGLPFGCTLLAPAGEEARLEPVADALHRASCERLGATDVGFLPVAPRAPTSEPADDVDGPHMDLVAVGAHMRGLPLNHQLTDLSARFMRVARTAPCYRLYALPGTSPHKPGLLRVAEGGRAIEVEVFRVPLANVGAFLAQIPPPLALGNLELEGGEMTKGFLCEPYGLDGAQDITRFGGFRAYLAS